MSKVREEYVAEGPVPETQQPEETIDQQQDTLEVDQLNQLLKTTDSDQLKEQIKHRLNELCSRDNGLVKKSIEAILVEGEFYTCTYDYTMYYLVTGSNARDMQEQIIAIVTIAGGETIHVDDIDFTKMQSVAIAKDVWEADN